VQRERRLAACSGALTHEESGWTRLLHDVARDLPLGALSTHRASFRPHDLACLGIVRAVTQKCPGVRSRVRHAPCVAKCYPCRACRLTRAGHLLAHKLQQGFLEHAPGPWRLFSGLTTLGGALGAKRVMETPAPMRCPHLQARPPLEPSTRLFGVLSFPNHSHVKRYGWLNERHKASEWIKGALLCAS
jgi:hypothetical protein